MNTIKIISNSSRIYLYLFLNTFFLYNYNSMAQELPCANEIFQTKQLQDTGFLRQLKTLALLELQNNSNNSTQRITGNVLEIPVVVHVLHLGEPVGTGSNISDQQIYDAIQGTNERWRNISTTNDPRSVDMEVQFCLAQFDPNGNPTNGITRTDASSMPLYSDIGIGYIEAQLEGITGSDEIATKNLSNWRHNYVYNIWVVHKIAGGWGGYAFFPVAGEYSTDGVVITTNSMRYTSSTLAHELGHGMSLFHTFQGSENGCAANDICFLQGDWICDTPPHRKSDCENTPCNNSPDSMLTFKNFMSYCGGRGLFTQGQKDRVRTSIYNTSRAQLLYSHACSGPPCDTARTTLTAQTCNAANVGVMYDTLSTSKGCDSIVKTTTTLISPAPTANFTFVSNGQTVTFTNTSQNGTSYTWKFGDDSTSNQTSPTHTYLTPGSFNVTLITENACSSDTADATITILSTGIKNQSNAPKINVYPNPSNGNFTVNFEVKANESALVEITNTLGQIITTQELSSGKEHTLSFANKLAKGTYQLQIKKNGIVIGVSMLSVE